MPTRDKDGNNPEGVPPNLLQGQAQVALAPGTTGEALELAGLGPEARADVSFGFSQPAPTDEGGRNDIIVTSVTAPDRTQAIELANVFAEAYMDARGAQVAAGNKKETAGARTALNALGTRLATVKEQLGATNPGLLPLVDSPPSGGVGDRR